MSKTLVAYFSASGTTKKVAEGIAKVVDADIYEIIPEIPYTTADLNWMDKNSRSSVEMNDKSFRPAIGDTDANVGDYDTIYLGFPIWWYTCPTIINTFLEAYDFSNKKIILFATSGSSGISGSLKDVKASVDSSATVLEGQIIKDSSERNIRLFVEKY